MSDPGAAEDAVHVAVVQLCSGDDRSANLTAASEAVREAAGRGAQVVSLPEMWPFIGSDNAKVAGAEDLSGPA